MARVIQPPAGSGPQNDFEIEVLERLRGELDDSYVLIPNFELKPPHRASYEYDVVILAPHGVFVVEAKAWYGRLTGDDREWLLNRKAKRCPLPLVNLKCKILKTALGPVGRQVWIEPLLVVPDEISLEVNGQWARNAFRLGELVERLRTPQGGERQPPLSRDRDAVIRQLLETWLARPRSEGQRLGGYQIIEAMSDDGETAEYLARRALYDDPARFRIRLWRIDPTRPVDMRKKQLAVIRRPAEALARIGRHDNLLPLLDFGYDEERHEFYEITEWSDIGTLHGFFENQARDPLTLRERLEIALGVARALEAVHTVGLVHRNLCPETIVVGLNRRPLLTDFDRAYLQEGETVFEATTKRLKDPAYLPPELADATDYDFTEAADMYAFGVLLYRLITDRVPFADAAEARRLSGEAPPPSAARDGVAPPVDQLVAKLLRIDDFNARATAAEATAVLESVLRGSSIESQPPAATTSSADTPATTFEEGQIIDGRYRVSGPLGSGGFANVYRVYHLDQQRTYAMKLLRRGEDIDSMIAEFTRGSDLPIHPNIAKTMWMDRLPPPDGRPYILSELVDGETLLPYCTGDRSLSLGEVRDIGLKLLEALAAFHPRTAVYEDRRRELSGKTLTAEEFDELQRLKEEAGRGILHRDLKPANILLELPSHEPKIIDFNIACQLDDATGRPGTPHYWAPDRGRPDWRPDMDLFSLGVVLYELATHRHPFRDRNPERGEPYAPRDVIGPDGPRLSEELAEFLHKAVQPAGADRYQTASEMRAALAAIPHLYAPVEPPATTKPETVFPDITLEPEEEGRSDYNPYVTRLQSLYSQARRTNAGTRGLDQIARLTYVETRLDTELAPAIVAGRYRMVIVTGNAGDGKTAFLEKVEELFRQQGAELESLPSGNGSAWIHGDLYYETNYDGSQDEGERSNDTVLERFFEPFAGPKVGGLDGQEVRLVAINEGRLLDFLLHGPAADHFEGLRGLVNRCLDPRGEAEEPTPERALVVNLNLRAIAAGGENSLMLRQLREMLRDELWVPCAACSLRHRCPIQHNVATLRAEAAGKEVRRRIHRLFDVLHLRRRAHVTMRDLRSALAWMLLRDHSCADIARLLENGSEPETLLSLAYSQAFAADGALRIDGGEAVDDRLVRLLREVDVGRMDDPQLDRRLDHEPTRAVPWMVFEGRSPYLEEVHETLQVPGLADEVGLARLLKERREHLARWRRRAYFERRDAGWQRMIPFRALVPLEKLMRSPDDKEARAELRDLVIRAVSVSEGLRNDAVLEECLALRASRVKEPSARSYRLFSKLDFSLRVPEPDPRVASYLEVEPDAVELVHAPRDGSRAGRARLRISLDLLEMLELIGLGYRPSPADLQGLFVNLQIFRNELLNLRFDRIVVTRDDREFYEISATSQTDGHIHLHLQRRPSAGEGMAL